MIRQQLSLTGQEYYDLATLRDQLRAQQITELRRAESHANQQRGSYRSEREIELVRFIAVLEKLL